MKEKRVKYIHVIVLIWVIIGAYMLCRLAANFSGNTWVIQLLMSGCLIAAICKGLWEKEKGLLTYESAIKKIVFMGMVMRIGYMLYTGCTVRSHDLGDLDINGYGHAAYILKLMQQGHLPETNQVQFYQQPFYYFISAAVSRGVNAVLGTKDAYYLVDTAKIVSCIASCSSIWIAESIFKTCGLKEKGMIRAMAFVAFQPAFFLCGGRVNPDMLAAMFMMLALLYTLYWMKDRSWKNTIMLAVIYGFGMMTKISCATMAAVTFIVFLKAFIKACRTQKATELIKKYAVFLMISLPLGLWYSVRNYLKFGQNLTYVLEQDRNSELYHGTYSLAQRMIGIDIMNLLRTPYASPWKDYNFPVYCLKSSLFGEFTYNIWNIIPTLLLCFACVLAGFVITVFVKGIKSQSIDCDKRFSLIISAWFYICAIGFYYKYPFGCSMDYRYLLILTSAVALIIGNAKFKGKKAEHFLDWTCMGYSICSCLMYCLI